MDKKLAVTRISVGPLATNCYLVLNKDTKKALLIDPGADAQLLLEKISQAKAKLEAIILTHGHADHIGALEQLSAPIYIHEEDVLFLMDAQKNLSAFLDMPFSIKGKHREIRLLRDGQELELAGMGLRIIHTPGHTPGSISVALADMLFTGDSLFAGSIGRTDFSYGSQKQLLDSIKNKLMKFSPQTKILPGHGEVSTIGKERANNLFINL